MSKWMRSLGLLGASLFVNAAFAGVSPQKVSVNPSKSDPHRAPLEATFSSTKDLPAHEAKVGTLAGQAATEGGAATYTVPIVVPPGRAGMEPRLTLSYNSRGGDGVMGVGWSISGLSVIHRCPQTPEQDGATVGVGYANTDRLCLDGQRLVKVNAGAYGQSGSEYRTEVDSYARITQTGGDLTGSATCFRVEQKDGRVLHYGAVTTGSPLPTACAASTANARVLASGATATLNWLVEKIEDRVGNNQTIAYTNFGNGEVLPGTISYTGFGAAVGDRTVTFAYTARTSAAAGVTDISSSYLAGGLTLQSQALESITTKVAGTTVRTITTGYVAAAYSGRLLLKNLTECAYDGATSACHPATQFAMSDGNYAPWFSSLASDMNLPGTTGSNPTASVASVRVIADLDGDGTRETAVSTIDTNGVHRSYLVQMTADRVVQGAVEMPEGQISFSPKSYADFDNDGRAELLAPGGGSNFQLVVWNLARGQVATSNPMRIVPTNIPLGVQGWGFALDDFDGDGHMDVALAQQTSACGSDALGDKEGVFVYLNANPPGPIGSSATFTIPSAPLFCLARTGSGLGVAYETLDHVADFNGDGLPDFFIRSQGIGSSKFVGVRLTQRSGGTLSVTAQSCSQIGLVDNPGGTNDDCDGTQGHVVHWMDVNGDGLEDFVIARPTQTWQLRLNRGGSFGPVIDTGSTAGLDTFSSTNPPFFRQFRYIGSLPHMDIDGDGKADLLAVSVTQGFALKMCTFARVPPFTGGGENTCPPRRSSDIEDPDAPTAIQCPAYACPEDPGSNTLTMPYSNVDQSHYWNPPGTPQTYFVFGNYAGYRGVQGLSDRSAYHLAQLKFVQTGASAFQLKVIETPLVSSLGTYGDDLYGDGLNDLITPIGGKSTPCPIDVNGGQQFYPCHQVIGDSTWGPMTLPDGTPTMALQEKTVVFANINPGVTGASLQLAQERQQAASGFWLGQFPAPMFLLPELLQTASDGMGDFAAWSYSPLAFPLTQSGIPLYTLPSTNGYEDARHYYFKSTMPVVSGMLQSSGLGGENIYSATRSAIYGYDSAIYNAGGRGFQGFRKIVAENGNFLRTTTTYHQKFPLTGKVASVETAVSNTEGTVLNRVQTETDTWRCTRTNRNTLCPGDNQTVLPVPTGTVVYQPFLDRQQIQNYDLGTGAPSSHVDTVNATSLTATTSGWDNPACNTGSGTYGNLSNQVVTSGDDVSGGVFVANHIQTTTHCYDLSGDAEWWIDKRKSTSVTDSLAYATGHALPVGAVAPNQTRTTDYTWNADRTPDTTTAQAGIANQRSTTTWAYPTPSYGLPSQVSINAPDLSPALSPTRATSYLYTKDGSSVAADGYFVLKTTNALNRTTTTTVQPRDGQIVRTTDPNGVQAVATYDPFGRATQIDHLGNTGQPYASSEKRAWSSCRSSANTNGDCPYDAVGQEGLEYNAAYRITTVQEGSPTRVEWRDSLDRPIKQAERGFDDTFIANVTDYDISGRVAQQSTPYFVNPVATITPYFTGWSYDALNRPTSKLAPGSELDPSHGDVRTDYVYNGRQTTITVHAAQVTPGPTGCPANTNLCLRMTRSTDVLGRLMQTTQQAESGTLTTDYWTDAQGQVAAIRDPQNAVSTARYNALGHRVASTDPDQGSWTFGVNAFGELSNQTDARGVVTTVTARDPLGRMTERTAVPPVSLPTGLANETVFDSWTYDPSNGIGQLGQQLRRRGTNRTTPSANPEVWRETMTYEPLTARLATTTTTISEGTPVTLVADRTYDAAGRLDTRTFPNPGGPALSVRYGYTDSGQLKQLSNASTSASYWSANAADSWGKITDESWPGPISGKHASFESTGQRYKSNWSYTKADEQILYGYDSFGNLASQQRKLVVGGSVTESYRYDRLQRLIQAARPGATVTYGYTANGNLDSKSDFSTAATGSYGYGSNGCGPHAVSRVTQASGTLTYNCDANGNVIGGNTLTATYDAENRPRTITRVFASSTPKSMGWTYASDGSRSTETTASLTRYFGRDGFEWNGATAIHELGPVVVRRTGATDSVVAVLKDALGSTVATLSVGQASRRSYDAFGAVREPDYSPRPNGTLNIAATIHGFTGHTHADDVALIHMGGRAYDPNLGRFLSVDPIIQDPANSQSLNPYSYVLNNPFAGRDPTGYAVKCNDNKTCGVLDSPTAPQYLKRKDEVALTILGNGADAQTSKGAASTPVGGQAVDIGAGGKAINGLSVTYLDGVTVRPTADDWDDARRHNDAVAFVTTPAAAWLGFITATNPWQRNAPGDDSIQPATLPGGWTAAIKGAAVGLGALRSASKARSAYEILPAVPETALKPALSGLEDLADLRAGLGLKAGEGTLARLEVDGHVFYGINAHGQPIKMSVNAISRTHAEADAFQQALNFGVRGGNATLHVDRALCAACGQNGGIRAMTRQLGLDQTTVITPQGTQIIRP